MKHDRCEHEDCWSRTPHYRPGAKLTAEQLNLSQADALWRDRLINVAMHGVGVAHGFQIRTDDEGGLIADKGCIHIGCGMAFDKYGRMLFWGGGWLKVADVVGPKPDKEERYTLSVHYAEKSDHGGAFDPCHKDTGWVERCVAFTLTEGCRPHDDCTPDVRVGICMTREDWICTRNGFHRGDVRMDKALAKACADIPPLASSDCGRVAYDPEAGIPLSCVKICDLDGDKEECHPRYGFCPCGEVESCVVRPVAYRSRLLYELINRDDVPLAKIASYGWSDWELKEWSDENRMLFNEFKWRAKACEGLRKDPPETVDPKSGFSFMFTRPVQRRTLHPLSVIMDIFILETRANYWEPWRIPTEILHLNKSGEIITDKNESCAWGAMICPEEDWIKYEIDDPKSTIRDCANQDRLARVEITIRGQIVRDDCGLMIDARPPDIDKCDSCKDQAGTPDIGDCNRCKDRAGQARPGGDFVSVFRIGGDAGSSEQDSSIEGVWADMSSDQDDTGKDQAR